MGFSAPLGLVSLASERSETPRARKEGIIQRFLWLDQLSQMTVRPIRQQIEQVWLFRARYAATLPEVGFSHRIPAMRSPLPGLFVASMVIFTQMNVA